MSWITRLKLLPRSRVTEIAVHPSSADSLKATFTEEELEEALATLSYEKADERVRLRCIYTSNFVEPLLRNAQIAVHAATHSDSGLMFICFSKLPAGTHILYKIYPDSC